jgi:hypothetical protein
MEEERTESMNFFENKDLLAMGLKDNQTALLCSRIADHEPPQ